MSYYNDLVDSDALLYVVTLHITDCIIVAYGVVCTFYGSLTYTLKENLSASLKDAFKTLSQEADHVYGA